MNGTEHRPLFSDGKTKSSVNLSEDTIANLFEDIRCLKEELEELQEAINSER